MIIETKNAKAELNLPDDFPYTSELNFILSIFENTDSINDISTIETLKRYGCTNLTHKNETIINVK